MMATDATLTPTTFGSELWHAGSLPFSPGSTAQGCFRVVVVDLREQQPLLAWAYTGTIKPAGKLSADLVEVTWSDAGTIRIVAHLEGGERRWYWSQPGMAWDIECSPSEQIAELILAALRQG